MNKTDFIKDFSTLARVSRAEGTYFTNKFLETLTACILSEEEVSFPNFGTIKVNNRKSKKVMHPSPQKMTLVPERKLVFFNASDNILSKLNKDNSKKK